MWKRDQRRQTFKSRTPAGLCLATAFALSTSLIAQSGSAATASSKDDKTDANISVSGCLAKSGDKFVLTNAHIDKTADRSGQTSTVGTAGTTGTTTTGATGTSGTVATGTSSGTAGTATGTSGSASGSSAASPSSGTTPGLTWVLQGGDDLDSKVGQKVQVTGRAGAVPDTSTSPTSTGAATGAATGTTGTTSTTGTSTGTAGATGTSGSASDDARNKVAAAQLKLDVKSVKTIASSCS